MGVCRPGGTGTHTLLKVSPPEDGDTCNAAEKLAMLVAEAGPEFEKVAVENNRNDKAFS